MSKAKDSQSSVTTPRASTLKQALEELAEAKAKLRETELQTEAMLDSLGEGLIGVDVHGAITVINRYALETLGFEEAELMGEWFPRAIMAFDRYEQPVEHLARPIIRAFTSGEAVSEYLHYARRDGEIIPVHVTVAPIMLQGKPVGAIEIFRDLTQERQLEIAKEEFVSLASHQLRTPATGVMTILSMLASGDFGPMTPVQLKYLRKAIETNNYQLQIIEDLLNAARVDAGKMSIDLEEANLAQVVREAVKDQAPITHSRNQSLRLRAPQKLMIPVDVQKIRMVLNNLISNASKYSHIGSEIQITLKADRSRVILSVADQGVGIPQDEIPRLFSKFTRLDNELSTSVGGTGLGLFLVKNLVELHNGKIDVTSSVGSGSTFTIILPYSLETS